VGYKNVKSVIHKKVLYSNEKCSIGGILNKDEMITHDVLQTNI